MIKLATLAACLLFSSLTLADQLLMARPAKQWNVNLLPTAYEGDRIEGFDLRQPDTKIQQPNFGSGEITALLTLVFAA